MQQYTFGESNCSIVSYLWQGYDSSVVHHIARVAGERMDG